MLEEHGACHTKQGTHLQSCKEKAGRQLKKRRLLEHFGFECGCQRALETSGTRGTTDADKERAVCGAKLLGCQSMVISIAKKMNFNDEVDIAGLFNKNNLDKLRAANIGFASGANTFNSYDCTFHLPQPQQGPKVFESKSDDKTTYVTSSAIQATPALTRKSGLSLSLTNPFPNYSIWIFVCDKSCCPK